MTKTITWCTALHERSRLTREDFRDLNIVILVYILIHCIKCMNMCMKKVVCPSLRDIPFSHFKSLYVNKLGNCVNYFV